MSERESTAEVQYRLHCERECRRIAELVKKELPNNRGFCLVTADYGGGPGASFSNTAYMATVEREDAARLLTELVDYWQCSSDIVSEPTVSTMTVVREAVHQIRGNPAERLLHGARCSVRDAEAALKMQDVRRARAQLIKLAAEALAIIDRLSRPEAKD